MGDHVGDMFKLLLQQDESDEAQSETTKCGQSLEICTILSVSKQRNVKAFQHGSPGATTDPPVPQLRFQSHAHVMWSHCVGPVVVAV